jgi:hypothetical protein
LKVVCNAHAFLGVIENQENNSPESEKGAAVARYNKLRWVWKLWLGFLIVLSSDNVVLTNDFNWQAKTYEWGKAFVEVFDRLVTTYIHMFVFHTEKYLKQLHRLQKFSCFSIESKHKLIENRTIISRITNLILSNKY